MTSEQRSDSIAKGERFRALHQSGIFIMPCAWDAMSALLFQQAGFEAIGTTSGGVNWSNGQSDYVYGTPSAEMLANYGRIAAATKLPVSGDLENGYSDQLDAVADVVRQAIDAGLVGGSIEDHSTTTTSGLLPVDLAAAKIQTAREAADASGITFTVTARAESFYADVADPLADAIARANRYADAGADCIFIPGLADLETIRAVTREVSAPLSLGIGSGGGTMSLEDLAEAGVRRVSTGGALPRAIYAFIKNASRSMLAGSFESMSGAISEADVNVLIGLR